MGVDGSVSLFLCGDVMTGRGVDQILPHPSRPEIFEPYVKDAHEYVQLAEGANGPIARPVAFSYVWGDGLEELERVTPDARIVNLETSITRSDEYAKGKGINYRMHPENVPCLTVARVDVCVLANNHVLDYGVAGLRDTLAALTDVGIKTAGAGDTLAQAQRPALVPLRGNSRLVVFGLGSDTSGIPSDWAARVDRPGVDLLASLGHSTASAIVAHVESLKGGGDIVVASVHWGSNWGYDVSRDEIRFAHWLVDGGVDIVHGHSSHHPRPIEVYKNRLILYGCGDLINDYEGIASYEKYRDDLVLMYFATLSRATGELLALRMTPMQIRKMRLNRTSSRDSQWLRDMLDRVGAPFGSHVELSTDGTLGLLWTNRA
jgi:poly-gamma-glutamate capsule biosynthesis protein CapA/YwtB (metallophosphatase superfamily)